LKSCITRSISTAKKGPEGIPHAFRSSVRRLMVF
jgi:hypothetical protein